MPGISVCLGVVENEPEVGARLEKKIKFLGVWAAPTGQQGSEIFEVRRRHDYGVFV